MSDNGYVATQQVAADFLKVSIKSISRYRKRGLPYKLMLNPVTGKQEVRFRYADLERWHEGRRLLAAYARDGEESDTGKKRSQEDIVAGDGFLDDLLLAYKQQIELLREQLEDMREQLARRDRQIDDLMRLMVGLQLEYKPMPAAVELSPVNGLEERRQEKQAANIDETMALPVVEPVPLRPEPAPAAVKPPPSGPSIAQKRFTREQVSASIQQLRRKGKSYEEIARGLNQINAATLSGHSEWTVREVQALLPDLVEQAPDAIENFF